MFASRPTVATQLTFTISRHRKSSSIQPVDLMFRAQSLNHLDALASHLRELTVTARGKMDRTPMAFIWFTSCFFGLPDLPLKIMGRLRLPVFASCTVRFQSYQPNSEFSIVIIVFGDTKTCTQQYPAGLVTCDVRFL